MFFKGKSKNKLSKKKSNNLFSKNKIKTEFFQKNRKFPKKVLTLSKNRDIIPKHSSDTPIALE